LAAESGEFPDASLIEGRMLPFCYEAGLISGHNQDAAHFMSVATESFVKEVLSSIFSRTRSNGPGESGSAGLGLGSAWIQTHKYRKQLAYEEDKFLNGEVGRDKSGLLPIEAKAASERGPLGMADVQIAMDMADCGLGRFPVLTTTILYNYREGELENWEDYTWLPGQEQTEKSKPKINGLNSHSISSNLPNGHTEAMDVDMDLSWEGAEPQDMATLDNVLDSCLAVGS
jgi:transcriptional coactivator HFI1/ADA1